MKRAKRITKEQELLVIEGRKQKKSAPVISKELGITVHQVYEVYKRYNITNKLHQEITIDDNIRQVILSGIIGDGSLKKNGCNYIYRECHAIGEREYCVWKMRQLGDLTKHTDIYSKNTNNNCGDAVEFTTKTTPSLNEFADLALEDIIPQLTEEGLILLLLDDGWRNNWQLVLTTHHYPEHIRELLLKRYNEVFKINAHYGTGVRKDLLFYKEDTARIFNWNLKHNYVPIDLDVMKKKFKKHIETTM